MEGLPPVLASGCYACISNQLFVFSSSSSGDLSVWSGEVGGRFQQVVISGDEKPKNRCSFSCSMLDETHIIVIGGEGDGIVSMEIWMFDVSAHTFTMLRPTGAPVKWRHGHCSVVAAGLCYIFGGRNCVNFCDDLLIVSVDLATESFTCDVINGNSTWPCPRIGHSMTVIGPQLIVFGGCSECGTLLDDVSVLDIWRFPKTGRFLSTDKVKGPKASNGHLSWKNDDGLWIAGDIEDMPHVNSIWHYNGKWKLHGVVRGRNVCAIDAIGLVSITVVDGEVMLRRCIVEDPFASLDSLFRQLRCKQQEHIEDAREDKLFGDQCNEKAALVREAIAMAQKEGGDVTNRIAHFFGSDFCQVSSDSAADKLRSAVVRTANLLEMLPERIVNKGYMGMGLMTETRQMKMKLDKMRLNFKRKKEERMAEIAELESHLAFLSAENTVTDVIDPADFSTFDRASSALPEAQRPESLRLYYSLQMRAYEHLLSKNKEVTDKLSRKRHWAAVRGDILKDLQKREEGIWGKTGYDERHTKWTGRACVFESEYKCTSTVLRIIREYFVNAKAVRRILSDKRNTAKQLSQQIAAQLKDMSKRDDTIRVISSAVNDNSNR